jgi:hypothetical protein
MRWGPAILLVVAGAALVGAPAHAPGLVAAALATTIGPLVQAWRKAHGTALRSAVVWAAAAVALGVAGEVLGAAEPLRSGRPGLGHLAYLSVLATLAALISVLNARTPGARAWAILMGLLVVVLLIPWLEAPERARAVGGLGRLRLDLPWSLFYVLLVVAGVTNYLPTRSGPAAVSLAVGLTLEYLALTRIDWSGPRRASLWSAVPWTLALALWIAAWRGRGRARGRGRRNARTGLEATWIWFRDVWGVVWALRVQERFNREAVLARWPLRLSWYGVVLIDDGAGTPSAPAAFAAAEATLRGLLRHFATPERIAEAIAEDPP